MATDYDAPRKQDEELKEDSLEQLGARRSDHQSNSVDEDETEAAEGLSFLVLIFRTLNSPLLWFRHRMMSSPVRCVSWFTTDHN